MLPSVTKAKIASHLVYKCIKILHVQTKLFFINSCLKTEIVINTSFSFGIDHVPKKKSARVARLDELAFLDQIKGYIGLVHRY